MKMWISQMVTFRLGLSSWDFDVKWNDVWSPCDSWASCCSEFSAVCNVDVVNCSSQNEDMAIISAQQYYVDYGLDLTAERLSSLLPSYLPDSYLETQKDANYWIQVQRLSVHTLCFDADIIMNWKHALGFCLAGFLFLNYSESPKDKFWAGICRSDAFPGQSIWHWRELKDWRQLVKIVHWITFFIGPPTDC